LLYIERLISYRSAALVNTKDYYFRWQSIRLPPDIKHVAPLLTYASPRRHARRKGTAKISATRRKVRGRQQVETFHGIYLPVRPMACLNTPSWA
jgi:hypothetical protein